MVKSKRKFKSPFYLAAGLLFFIVVLYCATSSWFISRFDITLKEFLYTMLAPLKGAGTGFLPEAISYILPYALIFVVLWAAYSVLDKRLRGHFDAKIIIGSEKKHISISYFGIFRLCFFALAVSALIHFTTQLDKTFKISEFISSYAGRTTIYEERYISPDSVAVTAPEKKKNLIYIYLESMEITYASKADGGSQPTENYIPYLTRLASENISFSNTDMLGGFQSISGTTWTMAALFSSTTGVPFSFPVGGNTMNQREIFAGGITSLGNILEDNGYRLEFLCGSDGDFAGRKDYFSQHGDYKIYDLFSAREDGYIPDDYFVWWGYEDAYLYEIAKDELTALSKDTDSPFNFTMLTVDTHHVDGYVCDSCPSVYDEQLGNVLLCADSQIYEFVQWCKAQPFYEDTVIIISGDHPRMDTTLIADIELRPIYNCFINTDKSSAELNSQWRTFTTMDMFPTILSALNFDIEGDRLGLGTDMFSGRETLAEEIGLSTLDEELNKYSQYYISNFS